MKYIEFKKGYKIYYKEYLSKFDNSILKMIYKNLNIYKLSSNKDKLIAGIQTPIIIKCDEFNDIISCADKLCVNLLKTKDKKIIGKITGNWAYIKKPKDIYALGPNDGFHTHSLSPFLTQNQLTWTYYYQIPNNCTGTQGKLRIKIDNEIFYIPIKEKTFYIFDSNWLHSPDISPESDRDRIVIAGSISLVYDENDIKTTQSFV
jgi:hypothetical protein